MKPQASFSFSASFGKKYKKACGKGFQPRMNMGGTEQSNRNQIRNVPINRKGTKSAKKETQEVPSLHPSCLCGKKRHIGLHTSVVINQATDAIMQTARIEVQQ